MPVAVRGPLSRNRNQDANYEMLTTWMAAAVAAMWEVFGGPFFSGEHEFTSGKHSLEGCASSLCLCCHRSSIALPWRHPPSLCLSTPPPAIPSLLDAHSSTASTIGIKSLSGQHREAVRRLPAALPLMPPITATTTVQYRADGGAFIRRRATAVLCPASCARLHQRATAPPCWAA